MYKSQTSSTNVLVYLSRSLLCDTLHVCIALCKLMPVIWVKFSRNKLVLILVIIGITLDSFLKICYSVDLFPQFFPLKAKCQITRTTNTIITKPPECVCMECRMPRVGSWGISLWVRRTRGYVLPRSNERYTAPIHTHKWGFCFYPVMSFSCWKIS